MGKIYYVYIHQNQIGELVYIGKGKGGRCKDSNNRNSDWHTRIGCNRWTYCILYENLEEDEALFLEAVLIHDWFGRTTNKRYEKVKTEWVVNYSYWNINKVIIDLRLMVERSKYKIKELKRIKHRRQH